MEAHVDLKLVGQVVAFVLMALAGGIAWGRLNERVKKHDKAIEGCHMDDYQRKNACADTIADCPGAIHSAETYQRVVSIESDVADIKTELKKSDDRFHDSQVQLGSTVSRIETQLGLLLQGRNLTCPFGAAKRLTDATNSLAK